MRGLMPRTLFAIRTIVLRQPMMATHITTWAVASMNEEPSCGHIVTSLRNGADSVAHHSLIHGWQVTDSGSGWITGKREVWISVDAQKRAKAYLWSPAR